MSVCDVAHVYMCDVTHAFQGVQWVCVVVCCGMLQCVAACCSVLQCVAVCCGVLRCVAVCCSVLQCVAVINQHNHTVFLLLSESLDTRINDSCHTYE